MYAGDKGPLSIQRSDTIGGLAPSSRDPIVAEYKNLVSLDVADLAPKAKAFLSQFGVNKQSTLPPGAPMILIGKPRLVVRTGARLVVWEVLNGEVPNWKPLQAGTLGDQGTFTDTAVGEGLYCGKGKGTAVYVQSESDGQSQLDTITAAVLNNAILFNTHSPGWAASVYHEILHTFEGTKMVNSFFLKEGIVETYSTLFSLEEFNTHLPDYYPPYKVAAENAEKLIEFTSPDTVAKAYFLDDQDSINDLIPIFYNKVVATLSPDTRLDPACAADAVQKWGDLSRMLLVNDYKLKTKAPEVEWYVKYAKAKGVPPGGPALPVEPPPMGGGARGAARGGRGR